MLSFPKIYVFPAPINLSLSMAHRQKSIQLNDPNVHLLDFIVNFLLAMANEHEQMSKCVQLIPWNIA